MIMPNFLIIGAAKAGTTSLYEYLKMHPEVYMSPRKETRFFAVYEEKLDFQGPEDLTRYYFVKDLASYQALFDGVTDEKAIGEASPWYLYLPKAAQRIKQHIPQAKLIAILREPVSRAYSHFYHSIRENIETVTDFTLAMAAETERIQSNWSQHWHYKQRGFYYAQLKHYYDLFEPEQIKVCLYDDLVTNPIALMQDIYAFLGVDDTFIPNTTKKHNVTAIPKSQTLAKFLKRSHPLKSFFGSLIPSQNIRQQISHNLYKINRRPKPSLQLEVRKKFIEEYREDILKLQELIDRDLSQWLEI